MTIGFATGCFDRFHEGHRRFLKEARLSCDYLIIAVNTDKSVRELKGANRPYDPLKVRMQHVIMAGADAVIPHDGHTFDLIRAIRPDVLIKGYDQTRIGESMVRKYGGHVERIEELPGFSTSTLEPTLEPYMTVSREGSKRKFVVLEDHRPIAERKRNATN